MIKIFLTDVERWLLLQALRAPDRDGTGKSSGNDVDRTADLLKALRARDWDRHCRHVMAHAKTRLRARAAHEAAKQGIAPDSPIAEPSARDLAKEAEGAVNLMVNDLDPDGNPSAYDLSRDDIECLHDEIGRMNEQKSYRYQHADLWRDLRHKIADAFRNRADGASRAPASAPEAATDEKPS